MTQDLELLVAIEDRWKFEVRMRHQDLAKTLIYLAVQTLASQCADMLLRIASADVNDILIIALALGER